MPTGPGVLDGRDTRRRVDISSDGEALVTTSGTEDQSNGVLTLAVGEVAELDLRDWLTDMEDPVLELRHTNTANMEVKQTQDSSLIGDYVITGGRVHVGLGGFSHEVTIENVGSSSTDLRLDVLVFDPVRRIKDEPVGNTGGGGFK